MVTGVDVSLFRTSNAENSNNPPTVRLAPTMRLSVITSPKKMTPIMMCHTGSSVVITEYMPVGIRCNAASEQRKGSVVPTTAAAMISSQTFGVVGNTGANALVEKLQPLCSR